MPGKEPEQLKPQPAFTFKHACTGIIFTVTVWSFHLAWAAPPGMGLQSLLPEAPDVQAPIANTESAQSKAERQRKWAQQQAAEEKERIQAEAETKELKAQALAELNNQAASGDLHALQTLLEHAPTGEDARPGLTAAAAGGSKLAAFIMAVWDLKTDRINPDLREQTTKTLQTLGDYFPAQYWLANNSKGSDEERQARLDKLVASTQT